MQTYLVTTAAVLCSLAALGYMVSLLVNTGARKVLTSIEFPFLYGYHAFMLVAGVVLMNALIPFVFISAVVSEVWHMLGRIPQHVVLSWRLHCANVANYVLMKRVHIHNVVVSTFG